jgi:predicted  nucleic acid-binding Zn-ribbon protein
MTKPEPLDQDILDRYSEYLKEQDVLVEKKKRLDEKSAKIITDIDTAEKTTSSHKWSQKHNNTELIKRLYSDLDTVKSDILAVEKEVENLKKKNNTLQTLIKIYDSRVKGYEEYLVWKEESDRKIYEAYIAAE